MASSAALAVRPRCCSLSRRAGLRQPAAAELDQRRHEREMQPGIFSPDFTTGVSRLGDIWIGKRRVSSDTRRSGNANEACLTVMRED
jgi:hypothetical protein